jgi:hypothetical protein
MAQRLLGDIQRAVVALQEVTLQAEADRLRRLDPTLRLKDYRLRRIHGLHGTSTIRVLRLVRVGTGERAPAPLRGSARSTAAYRQLLARLGAWISFRTAARLVEELFPLASGGSTRTVRRRVLAGAARLEAEDLPIGSSRRRPRDRSTSAWTPPSCGAAFPTGRFTMRC